MFFFTEQASCIALIYVGSLQGKRAWCRALKKLFDCVVQGGSTQRSFSGSGANEDIVVASARAYVSALNKLIAFMAASQRAAGAAAANALADEPEMAPTH